MVEGGPVFADRVGGVAGAFGVGLCGEALDQCCVFQQPQGALGHGLMISAWEQECGFLVGGDVGDAADIAGYYGQARGEAFEDGTGHAVEVRTGEIDVRRIVELADLQMGNAADKGGIAEAELCGQLFQFAA